MSLLTERCKYVGLQVMDDVKWVKCRHPGEEDKPCQLCLMGQQIEAMYDMG